MSWEAVPQAAAAVRCRRGASGAAASRGAAAKAIAWRRDASGCRRWSGRGGGRNAVRRSSRPSSGVIRAEPAATADRRGITPFRGSTALQPRRLLSGSFGGLLSARLGVWLASY